MSLREHWTLESDLTFLNHGSFGATPGPVLAYQSELRARIERQPVKFFVRDFEEVLHTARLRIAEFVGADVDNLVAVDNASTGVNTVLRSLDLGPEDEILVTDHEYVACRNALDFVARRSGAAVRIVHIPLPLEDPREVVDAITSAVEESTRLLLVDHVTSQTGLVLPLQDIVDAMNARAVPTLVDGAHGPGMVDVDLERLGATYYTGNLHKWVCAPKGAAFLWVDPAQQQYVRPLVISHGASLPTDAPEDRFQLEFWWQGTRDPTPFLAAAKAVDFVGSLAGGWGEVRRRNRDLALRGRTLVEDAIGAAPLVPDSMIGSLAAIELPDGSADTHESPLYLDPLQTRLLEEYRIEVPIIGWPRPPHRLLRISAHLYNDEAQYTALARALAACLEE